MKLGVTGGNPMTQDREVERQRLGQKLKDAREYLALSQDEVAKLLHLPRSAISLIEAGQRKIDAFELKKLSEIYQIPISKLTGDESESGVESVSIKHLARTASKLSDRDREELLRFAQFLQIKGQLRTE
ncbi:transcriptional regulator with XRE-family HTH domain [Azospirillum lipoferum]|nr:MULTISPECIES: helix-turn-helix transcriptional regulator [Azospirillum]MCP1612135.1 transcriptional regulator with XRE-family HTH domain [Azospirillum lipoferum]MDW5536639.1 helix-turn-helix transcriptional regulator [Azospirillum sp. NL1]